MNQLHFRRWLNVAVVLVAALVVSACGSEDPESQAPFSTNAPVSSPQFEIANIEGHLYQAGVRGGGGGHTTVFLVTPDGVILADPINAGFSQWLEAVMLPDYSDWLLYETRRPALVGNMYDFLSQD